MTEDHLRGVVFRSGDGESLYARDGDGPMRVLLPDPEQEWLPDERHRILASELERYGLWRHLTEEQRTRARKEVEEGQYPFNLDLLTDEVVFFADGETLAEGGVERFLLQDMKPRLSKLGLPLDVATARSPYGTVDEEYVIAINGIACVVWTAQDWHADGAPWDKATIRPLATINQLLTGISPVRAHTLYAGANEGLIYLIEPGVAEAVRVSGLLPEWETPALAQ